MPRFSCDTAIPHDHPAAAAGQLVAAAEPYGLTFTREGDALAASGPFGRLALTVGGDALHLRAEADDRGLLERLRASVSEQLAGLLGEELSIVWTGDVETGPLFTDFREIRVIAVRDLTPRLRRITFLGRDLDRFATPDNLHVRLYLPPDGATDGMATPSWPRPGPDGRPVWPDPERRPAVRYYTLRRIDAEAGELDIDFVLHPDHGHPDHGLADGAPGADFARRARPGALCGMSGPCGLGIRPAPWHLLAGDETALPAIARILEELPADARGTALIEVEDAADELPLRAPAGVVVRWLRRRGGGTARPLVEAVQALTLPDDLFAWVACEFEDLACLRDHLRGRGIDRDRMLTVAYWRRTPPDTPSDRRTSA
ncbi:NADPH-dependent ferric siderophore reductase [Azospirillum lipoferum]|uniref:Siderophore-interacting protein n=1 Tax=Azospirillum lipoferum TaxID=193 RepID=A0A5A9GG45_AZOLI|nr:MULTISPECIES: siderophore-interacting protein [Azospirillum]KAA0592805.1 siderophore-interacting protein [Azospirillum lipoferum]MCP1614235.1 NADPH-dependent ferric siderophore reductase [Azospirillum lipoferum]MDW5531981.1 siderophore-interacting protein [Azospirillum sp. NL1]